MKSQANTLPASTTRRRMIAGRLAAFGVSLLLPFLMGGCPQFRNDVVDLFEAATRSALLSTQDPIAIADTATLSFVDAAFNLLFDQFRTDQFQTN